MRHVSNSGMSEKKSKKARAALLPFIILSASLFSLAAHQAIAQGVARTHEQEFDLKNLPVLKGFVSVATDYHNRKAETFWYKGSAEYTSERFSYGFSEVNYTVLRFSSRKAMMDWDARFDRIGIRSEWRTGDVFKNADALKAKVVSEFPWPTGLIALHLDFSVGNTVILVGGNQHKNQFRHGLFPRPRGLADVQLKRTVQAVAQELKRQVSLSERAKLRKQTPMPSGIIVSLSR